MTTAPYQYSTEEAIERARILTAEGAPGFDKPWALAIMRGLLAGLSAPSQAGAIPEGMVLVPREFIEALVNHNDNARSFFQIANRVATELGTHALQTNFGAFADTTERMLSKWHQATNDARAMLAACEPKKDG